MTMEMLYERVAASLRSAIGDGAFRPGSRLPGLRRISNQYDVSLTTAIQAYRQLEAEGLIRAHARSGYFVNDPGSVAWPEPETTIPAGDDATISVSRLVLEMITASRTPGRINLGATLPDPNLLPTRALGRMMGEAIGAPATSIGRYGWIEGEPVLRERIAQHMTLAGSRVAPEDVVITNGGGMQALSIAIQTVTRAGDTVAVESPTFYGLLQILEGLGLKAVELPTEPRSGLDPYTAPEMARAAGAAALVTIPNGHNPLGYRMPDAAKEALVRECARIDLPIVEDDVYGDLAPEPRRPAPLKAWDRDGHVLLCSSFSKVLGPGIRVGWVAAGPYAAKVAEAKFRSTGTSTVATERTLAEYLRRGRYDRVVRNAARHYGARLDRLRARVAESFPPGTRIARPAVGFTLWIALPEDTDTMVLYRRALEHNIVIAPGELFAPGDRYRSCLRLNAAFADEEGVPEAVRQLARLASSSR